MMHPEYDSETSDSKNETSTGSGISVIATNVSKDTVANPKHAIICSNRNSSKNDTEIDTEIVETKTVISTGRSRLPRQ